MVVSAPAVIVALGGMGEDALQPLAQEARGDGYEPHFIRVPVGLCELVTDQYKTHAKPIEIELATATSDEVVENFALLWDTLHYLCLNDSCAACHAAFLAGQLPSVVLKPRAYLVFSFNLWKEGRASGERGTHLRRMLAHLFCTLLDIDQVAVRLCVDRLGLQLPSQAAMREPWYDTCRRFN